MDVAIKIAKKKKKKEKEKRKERNKETCRQFSPLAQEPPYAMGAALDKTKRQKQKQTNKQKDSVHLFLEYGGEELAFIWTVLQSSVLNLRLSQHDIKPLTVYLCALIVFAFSGLHMLISFTFLYIQYTKLTI